MTTSNTAPLLSPEDEITFQDRQDREHVRAPAVFKGQTLLPYSRGTKLLYGMVCDDNDLVIYRVLSFIYIHTHPRKDIIRLAWKPDEFREVIIAYRETLTDDDEKEAQRITEELFQAERDSQITTMAGAEKKTDANAELSPATSVTTAIPSAPS
jgi:hypothetical protein